MSAESIIRPIVGLFLWALMLVVGYTLMPLACQIESSIPVVITAATAAVVTIVVSAMSYRAWRSIERNDAVAVTQVQETETLSEFFAVSGLLLNGMALAMIAVTALAAFFLNPCAINSMVLP